MNRIVGFTGLVGLGVSEITPKVRQKNNYEQDGRIYRIGRIGCKRDNAGGAAEK